MPGTKTHLLLAALAYLTSGCQLPDDNEPSEPSEPSVEAPSTDLDTRCRDADEQDGITRPEGWAWASHCRYAEPDYDRVFGNGVEVKELVVHITRDNYAAIEADLEELLGGLDGPGGGPMEDWPVSYLDACEGLSRFDACTRDGVQGVCIPVGPQGLVCLADTIAEPGGDGGGPDGWPGPDGSEANVCEGVEHGDPCERSGLDGVCVTHPDNPDFTSCAIRGFSDGDVSGVPDHAAAGFFPRKPLYTQVDVEFEGIRWTGAGFRYKGNNGLASSTEFKRPFRLELDQFEDEDPQITNQRLFGFKELSFASNGTDRSFLHQHGASATFLEMGVPAPRTTPILVQVVLDDAPPRDMGLYTMTEIPGKPLLDLHFGNHDGNLYKPDGRGAHFVDFVEDSFHKKSNDDSGFEDVEAFVAALHDDRLDAEAWRGALEERFDMPAFIRFLAVNQAIGNWDTYGGIAHNFYLYTDEEREVLQFIPWDFDLSFDGSGPSDLSLSTFDGTWPLIQAVLHDPAYYWAYHQDLRDCYLDLYAQDQLVGDLEGWADGIRAIATLELSDNRFDRAIGEFRTHLQGQKTSLLAYLEGRGVMP